MMIGVDFAVPRIEVQKTRESGVAEKQEGNVPQSKEISAPNRKSKSTGRDWLK